MVTLLCLAAGLFSMDSFAGYNGRFYSCAQNERNIMVEREILALSRTRKLKQEISSVLASGLLSNDLTKRFQKSVSVLSCVEQKLGKLSIECESRSLWCQWTGAVAYANFLGAFFGAPQIIFCHWDGSYFYPQHTSISDSSTLFHEYTHWCGTKDIDPRTRPNANGDRPGLRWEDNVEVYVDWYKNGLYTPGI